jgi:hypothetical protein
MSGDQPGSDDWATPGQPTPSPAGLPGASIGWGTTPPTPPPPQGWAEHPPAPPPPPPPGWGQPPPAPGAWTNAAPYGWTPTYVQQAPKPGVIPLRPLGVGELLDGAFTTIRRYPAATLGLSALVMLFVETVQLLVTYWLLHGVAADTSTAVSDNGDYAARMLAVDGVVLVVTLVATVLLTGMITTVIGQAVLGRPMGISDAWERTRPLLLRLIGTTIAVFVISLLAAVAAAVPGGVILVLGIAAGSDAVLVFGVVVMCLGAVVGVIYVGNLLVMTTPALVLEKLTLGRALSRSRALVRGSWWRVFGILLLSQLIASVIGGVLGVPFQIAGGLGSILSGNVGDQFHFVPLLLTGIGGLLSGTVVRPFSAGVTALLYIDRRMRAEALDLTLQQAAAS